jgi:putative membrane protein
MYQWESIVNFLTYLGISIPLLIIGMVVFVFTTPYREYQLIREGADTEDPKKRFAAQATATELSGKILGLAIVLASAILNSLNISDLLIWGGIGVLFQVIIFYLFHFLTPFSVIEEIPKGNIAVAIFSFNLSIVSGLLLAALISY